jgi:hypothetical protein
LGDHPDGGLQDHCLTIGHTTSSVSGFLLGGAVNATAARGDAVDIDLHDAAVGEETFQFPFGG